MGPGYGLQELSAPINKGGAEFGYVINRNFATELEPAGSPVFYFMEGDEAKECLIALLSQS